MFWKALTERVKVMAPPTVAPNGIPVGTTPTAIGLDAVRNILYVANFGSNNVSVIDAARDTVTATIPVGRLPSGVDQVDVGGNSRVFVSNFGSNNVTVLDGKTNQVITTIPVGRSPTSVVAWAAGPDNPTPLVFVTNGDDNTVTPIDATTNSTLTPLSLTGRLPLAAAINRRTSLIYVVTSASDSVNVIDGHAFFQVNANPFRPIITGVPGGFALDVDEGRNRVYVADAPGGMTVIDGNIGRAITRVPVGNGPDGVAFNPNTSHIFVANAVDDTVSVLNASDLTERPITLHVGRGPRGMVLAPGNKIYVANGNDNSVSVIRDSRSDPMMTGLVTPAPSALAPLGITHLLQTPAGVVYLRPSTPGNQAALALTALVTRPAVVSGLAPDQRVPLLIVTSVQVQ
ncbi:MAG: hypothetical protein ACM3XM_12110 [Mycobacterium leprae]